ncbi:MAG TPA: arginase family protein, partial [Patescibacteria group bacterium]|nr:arginase family protein [Patescibacteria group bacterium]
NGPDAILTEVFLRSFPESALDTFDFPLPETLTKEHYESAIATSASQCRDLITQTLKRDEIQIAIGGDHSITFSTFLAVLAQKQNPQEIGYIQFDSHGDMNLRQESLTDNFHGMYVRAFLDADFDMPKIKALVSPTFPATNVLFIGNLDLDETGEKQYFTQQHIAHISKNTIRSHPLTALAQFTTFIQRFKHVHITFDIDGLDKSIAGATGIPATGGLVWDDIEAMLRAVDLHPSFSFDLVEVNPQKPDAQQTINIAQKILQVITKITV